MESKEHLRNLTTKTDSDSQQKIQITQMFKLVALFLLVALSQARDSEFAEQMDSLQASKFGRTLLQTIYMQIQTEDPVANLIEILENIQSQLEAEQRRDDDRNEHTQVNCEADLEQLNQVINAAQLASLDLKSELDGLNPQKGQSVSALNRKNSEIDDLNTELEEQTQKRDAEKARYEETLDELEQALYGLNQVRNFFNQYLDELNKNRRMFDKSEPREDDDEEDLFLQVRYESDSSEDQDFKPIEFAQLTQQITKVKHQIKQEGYKQLVQVLVEISTEIQSRQDEASEAELLTRKIIAILKQIEQYIADDRLKCDQSEEARQSLYEELEDMYDNQIVQAKADKAAMEGLIESLSSQILSAQNEKFETDLKITQKSSERDDLETDCLAAAQDYEVETQKRDEEKQALQLALELISSKLGQLKKEMMEQGGY